MEGSTQALGAILEQAFSPPRKQTLIEIDREYREIVREIEYAGELTEENEVALRDRETALCLKVDGYGVINNRLEQEAEYWKAMKQHCEKAEKTFTNAQKRLKERMKYVLRAHPDRSLQGDIFRFYLKKSQDSLIIDEELVPKEFKTVKIQLVPDRDAIEKELKLGRPVPGAQLRTDNVSLCTGKPQ